MTRPQFTIATAASGLALALTLLVIIFALMNRSLERQALEQQAAINRGGVSQQIGRSLLTEMGQTALRNTKMRDLLSRNGYTINTNSNSQEGGAR